MPRYHKRSQKHQPSVSELEIKQQKDHPTVSSQMAFKQATNEVKKARSVKNHEEEAK